MREMTLKMMEGRKQEEKWENWQSKGHLTSTLRAHCPYFSHEEHFTHQADMSSMNYSAFYNFSCLQKH